uniref:Putative helicase n=1 Tax=viral metagenome TaxID=1070528 RepID=A0A6M3L4S7_9ZZZZ
MDEKRTISREFSTKRYILILDEFHHVEEGGEWFKAMAPIVEQAKYLVLMTGTIERGDGSKIAYLEYKNDSPHLSGGSGVYIKYGRAEALKEKAVLPLTFFLSDGFVEWEDRQGQRQSGVLSSRVRDSSAALFTALDTDFADELMRAGVEHWEQYGRKLLIVTANIEHAGRFWLGLKREGYYSKIATSHESRLAMKNIKEFKHGRLDILVTIAMAYEGLDVPEITHIICLTHIRSVPWIEQMIARAVRIDRAAGPYESQRGYIFAPDDFLFRSVVSRIEAEQLPIAVASSTQDERNGEGEGERRPGIIPLGSKITSQREVSLGEAVENTGSYPSSVVKTVKEKEEELLSAINSHVCQFAFLNRYKPERINAEIKAHFGSSRREMSEKVLRDCFDWVLWAYPIAGRSTVTNVSLGRGRGERVPVKAVSWEGE